MYFSSPRNKRKCNCRRILSITRRLPLSYNQEENIIKIKVDQNGFKRKKFMKFRFKILHCKIVGALNYDCVRIFIKVAITKFHPIKIKL